MQLCIEKRTLYEELKSGRLRPTKVRRRTLFYLGELDRYMRDQTRRSDED